MQAVLEDWESAPVDERTRATLGFLRKLTLAPAEVGPADVEPVRQAGVGDEAIVDAIHVCVLFNIINRVTDALGVEALTDEKFDRGADFILRSYY